VSLLALQSLDRGRCAKRFLADGTIEGYGRTKWWRPVPAQVTSLPGLYRALVRLARRPDLCVVRGALIDPTAERILRRAHGDGAALRDADRTWLCADIDAAAPPPGMPVTADNAVAYLRSLLPPWLGRAGLVLQWSQSAGRDDWALLKAHLWFWLARGACSGSLYRWARKHPVIDASMMLPVQPHYTADPIIEDGWTGRPAPSVVLFEGPAAVVPADILCLVDHAELVAREERERAHYAERVRKALEFTHPLAVESQARVSVRRLGRHQARKILDAAEGGRHRAIVNAVKAVAALGRELRVSHHDALREVADAGRAVLPAARHHEVEAIIKALGEA
jgi:hypothetical protein